MGKIGGVVGGTFGFLEALVDVVEDGSLIASGSKGANTITITANTPIYTQSFTKKENIILFEHIKDVFNIKFKIANKITIDISYSEKEELKIIEMIQNDCSIKQIAINLGRTYDGVYDKIRRMKIENKL